MDEIKIIVKGSTGTGKSHVLAVLERALAEAYGPLMKIECQELITERNLFGGNLDSWNRPNPTQVTIRLEEENVSKSTVTGLNTSWPIGPISSEFVDFAEDETKLSVILVDCIDPSLAGALRSVLESRSLVAVERTPSRTNKLGRTIDLMLTFDAELVNPLRRLFTQFKVLQNQRSDRFAEYGNMYLISSKGDTFNNGMLLSLHGATPPIVQGDKGFIQLTAIDVSPASVNQLAFEAWQNRNNRSQHRGYTEQLTNVQDRKEFVPSIKCPPFDK